MLVLFTIVLLWIGLDVYAWRTSKILHHSCLRRTKFVHEIEDKSDTPTIVILHGLLGSSRNFQTWSRILYKNLDSCHDIICMDLRNHGRSSLSAKSSFAKETDLIDMDYEGMAYDVLLTLKKIKVSNAHVIGHSMGGKVAAAIALVANQFQVKFNESINIRSVTLMDISPIQYSPQFFTSVTNAVKSLKYLKDSFSPTMKKNEFHLQFTDHFPDKDMRAFMLSNVQFINDNKNGNNSLLWNFDIDSIHNSVNRVLDFIPTSETIPTNTHYMNNSTPLLLMKGSNSSFVRSNHIELIKPYFPNYNMVTIRNADHNIHMDKPEETSRKVTEFISLIDNRKYNIIKS
eukprot:gene4725-6630_t